MATKVKDLGCRVTVEQGVLTSNLISRVWVNPIYKNLISRVTVNYSMPQTVDFLNNPDHARSHRIIAVNHNAPAVSMGIDGDGNMILISNIVMASGKGIDFSDTGDAGGMTSELLNDYEEGKWTPAYVSAGLSFTYDSATEGWYTKVGDTYHCWFRIYTTSKTGATANAVTISGLPGTVSTAHSAGSVSEVLTFTVNHPSAIEPTFATATLAVLYRTTANGATIILLGSALTAGVVKNQLDGYFSFKI